MNTLVVQLSSGTVMIQYMTESSGLVVGYSPGVWEVMSSVSGQVIPKTFKMVLDASLLSAQHLKIGSRTYGRFPFCRL